jgi:hypothetical protein
MSLRFLKISNYYRGFVEDYYQRNSHVKTLGYTEQYRHLMDQYFAWSDNYGQLLAERGLETLEIVANADWMQKAWAHENGMKASATSEEIILNQIIKFRPEVIYFQDSMTFNGSFVLQLRNTLPNLKLCIGNLCAPFGSGQIDSFKAFDYFTVCSPFFKQQLGRFGIDSVVIPHAFDGRILNAIGTNNNYPTSSIVFLGSIFADEGFHSLRREILENLVKENIQFNFYGNLPDRSKIALLKKQASFMAARILDSLGLKNLTESVTVFRKGRNHDTMPRSLKLTKELYRIAQAPLFGLEMFKALSRAQVGFNIHIDCAGDYAANMRMFETTGVGTCLLTDRKSNLKDYFLEDTEVVAYDSVAECMEKIRYLVDHPLVTKEIGLCGQKRTLEHHNFEARVDLFYEFMMQKI